MDAFRYYSDGKLRVELVAPRGEKAYVPEQVRKFVSPSPSIIGHAVLEAVDSSQQAELSEKMLEAGLNIIDPEARAPDIIDVKFDILSEGFDPTKYFGSND